MWTFKSALIFFQLSYMIIKPTEITSQKLLKAILSPFEKSIDSSYSVRHSLQGTIEQKNSESTRID